MPKRESITIRKERLYPDPPDDVWVAITDARALAECFEPNDHQPVVGHRFKFVVDGGKAGCHAKECEVLDADPPRRLVWDWRLAPSKPGRAAPKPMRVCWTLSPESDGTTKLVLEHVDAQHIGWLQRTLMRIGWGVMMKKSIPRILANIHDGAFTPGAIPLNKRYYSCKNVPVEYAR